MCFSTEASFVAATVITTTGIIAYKKAGTDPIRFIAIFPILFGLHQFVEGWVWMASLNDSFSGLLKASTYGFLILAWVIWPVVIPLTLWRVEQKRNPKEDSLLDDHCWRYSGVSANLFSLHENHNSACG